MMKKAVKRCISDTDPQPGSSKRKVSLKNIFRPISSQSSSENESDISIHDDSSTEETFPSETL